MQREESVVGGSAYGAGVCTSTALDASVLVDYIFAVALGDSVNGAACCASAASDAIVRNFVCHCEILLLIV